MKALLRTLFRPLLDVFERGTEPYAYRPLNRKLLIVMGVLFSGLAAGVYLAGRGAVGVVCLVVGGLGNERAVSRIWGNK